jgi:hypothetical protein
VFAKESVIISSAPQLQALQSVRVPIAIIRPEEGQADPEFSELHEIISRTIRVTLVSAIAGDAGLGQSAILGGPRVDGNTKSTNRGLLELEEEVFYALKHLSDVNGLTIQHKSAGVAGVTPVTVNNDILYVHSMDITFDLFTTSQRYYHPPMYFVATPASGGTVNLSWTLPPDRYDRLSVVLRRASGATPPATPAAGTSVTLSGLLATSVTDAPGAGTFSYALFAAYDEWRETPTTADRYSDAVTQASVTPL